LLATLSEVCANEDLYPLIGLEETEDMSVCLIDSTFLQANIHFPVEDFPGDEAFVAPDRPACPKACGQT